jgi:hypothetical protein
MTNMNEMIFKNIIKIFKINIINKIYKEKILLIIIELQWEFIETRK